MDYYRVLGVKRDCTDAQIKQAYRVAALREHPDKNPSKDRATQEARLAELAEAYEVLSNAKLRSIFDYHGEKGLKQGGIPDGKGGQIDGWKSTRSSQQVFDEFFGSSSPFTELFTSDITVNSLPQHPKQPTKLESQTTNLYCSLEELYQGAIKKIKVVRQRIQSDCKTIAPEEKVLTVEVRPGWKAGTKITFPNEGDEALDHAAGDIVLVLKEKPHPQYQRSGNDLIFRTKISLVQALTGCSVQVPMLDGRVVPIPVSEIVSPTSRKVIAGEGMPLAKDPSQRGNLILEFTIEFPVDLSVDAKNKLKVILPQ